MSQIEEKQLIESVKQYAEATRESGKHMETQNYRDCAAAADRAAVQRQAITRWASILEARAAVARGV